MLKVICWKWKPRQGYRSHFYPGTVNTLRSMVRRHYTGEHEFICITDDATGIDPDIRIIPLWNDHANILNPFGAHQPNCYRRLKAFSKEAAEFIGERFVSLDLDTVILKDVAPLWDRKEEFVIWGDTSKKTPYNGSMFLLKAGSRTRVWETFHPVVSPRASRLAGYFGSDQGWIGKALGPHEKKWSVADGVYSFRNHILPSGKPPPPDARIVFFHGKFDPWQTETQLKHPWIKEHYR